MKIQITLDTQAAEDKEILALVLPYLGIPQTTEPTPSCVMDESLIEPILEPIIEEVLPVTEEPIIEEVKETQSEKKTTSIDEWRDAQVKKKKNFPAELHKEFNEFVKNKVKDYGVELPRQLSPEKLYIFIEEVFNLIEYDPIQGFYVNKNP